ncbi:hypothetical protein [Lacticaseibacillus daqingensis]|uniref:hypothetical protein n=1 Tax=Lacticaseibacillus daqingensis TaxID=2486014 RepID=UPI000F77DF99|nr:hypothetical protein [Lacticaseibacillus daqingensis]
MGKSNSTWGSTAGLLFLAIGFYTIMVSPAGPGVTNIRPGLLTLGVAFVLLGFWVMTRRRKHHHSTDNSDQS